MKLIRRIVLLLGSMFFCATAAYACECLAPRTPKKEMKVSNATFVGEVVEVGVGGRRDLVKFRVERTWKGPREEFIVVSSGRGTCSRFFTAGGRWLVYALYEGGELTSDICMRTRLLPEADVDLKALGKSKPVKTGLSKRESHSYLRL